MSQISNLPPQPELVDDSAMKLVLKIAAITAVVLLGLFALYWAGRQWLLPQSVTEELPDAEIVECKEIYTDLRLALRDTGQFNKPICGLDISNNKARELTVGITFMEELKLLKAQDNAIETLPERIGKLSQLEVLDLSNNRITIIPVEIAQLKKLKVLDLTGNPLSSADVDKIRELLPRTTVKF